MQQFNEEDIFHLSKDAFEKDLLPRLLDMVTKANQLLNIQYLDHNEKSKNQLKLLATLNKTK